MSLNLIHHLRKGCESPPRFDPTKDKEPQFIDWVRWSERVRLLENAELWHRNQSAPSPASTPPASSDDAPAAAEPVPL